MEHLLNLSVIYEDNHIIAVNKPAGVLVHGDVTGDLTLADQVKSYIKVRYGKPGDVFLGVVHRLDRPVSGVVIFARTSKALVRLNKMFQQGETKKRYMAVVSKRPAELNGTVTHYLKKDKEKNISRAFNTPKSGAKLSTLSFELKGELYGQVLLEVHPLTGRPHQIRVQLSKMGSPIIGDLKYGAQNPLPDKSIALHCLEMSFIHPVTKERTLIIATTPSIEPWTNFSFED